MNLILLEPGEVGAGGAVALADARASHILRVLHGSPGQAVRVGILDGPLGAGTITAADAGRVEMRCVFDATPPPRPWVDLLLALPRPKVLRRLWAQLAALGVGRIILTNAERVERHYFDTHILSPGCYRPLLIEGLQQARDTRLPAVSIHRQFRILVEDHLDALVPDGLRLVADPRASTGIGASMRAQRGDRVLLAVGPEGGWNDFEVELLRTRGFQRVGMGARTLRTDTACIALLGILHESGAAVAQSAGMMTQTVPPPEKPQDDGREEPDPTPDTPPTGPPPVPIEDPRPEGTPPGPYITRA